MRYLNFYFRLTLFVFVVTSCKSRKIATKDIVFNFEVIESKNNEREYITIKDLVLDGDSMDFLFDLGKPYSILYKDYNISDSFISPNIVYDGELLGAKKFKLRKETENPLTIKGGNNSQLCGVVGKDFFDDKKILIDFQSKEIVVSNKISLSNYKSISLEAIYKNGYFIIPLNYQNQKINALFNFGILKYPILFSEKFLRKINGERYLNIENCQESPNIVSKTHEFQSINKKYLTKSEICFTETLNLESFFRGEEINAIITLSFFKRDKLLIDLKNKSIYIIQDN